MFGEQRARLTGPSPLVDATPIEKVEGWDRVWVKREDLSCPLPGPCFSKIRGVYARISQRDEELIGVLDTYHSKAGWAVAYICSVLGKKCINFYPHYKTDDGQPLREQQQRALDFEAELHPLPAGRSAILFHTAKRETRKLGGYMMPNALKLTETVEECSAEVARTAGLEEFTDIVISISSATIAAGVLKGLHEQGLHPKVWLHMGYERSQDAVEKYMRGYLPNGLPFDITFINEKYGYKDQARSGDYNPPPFPCNPYYDLKAWRWMDREGLGRMGERVLFWNIGS
jgi:hypothetical protein